MADYKIDDTVDITDVVVFFKGPGNICKSKGCT